MTDQKMLIKNGFCVMSGRFINKDGGEVTGPINTGLPPKTYTVNGLITDENGRTWTNPNEKDFTLKKLKKMGLKGYKYCSPDYGIDHSARK